MSSVIYPGSFDPLTNGHIDVIERASRMFSHVTVAVSHNPQKSHVFDIDRRVDLVRQSVAGYANVQVDIFHSLLVEYAQKKEIPIVLRGLRAVSDFEYEFHLAAMNRKIAKNVETIFLMTGESSYFISSRLVREVASFGGDVSSMVPACVYEALQKKYKIG